MKRLKVVQIGLGHDHAIATIDCLLSLNSLFEVVGYVFIDDGEQANSRINSNSLKNLKRLTLEEAFSIPDLDCAVIETDDINLTKYAKLALERGLHVQMDKPGSQSEKDFNDMVDFAKQNGLVFHTGYMLRYNPLIKKAITMIKNGEIGKVYSIEAQMSCYLTEKKRMWLKSFDGGMINFLGCHLIDLILSIKGKPKNVIPLSAISREDIGGFDIGFAVLEYDNCIASVKVNGMEVGGPMRRKIVIVGEKGSIEINPIEYPNEENLIKTNMKVAYAKDNIWFINPKPIISEPFDRYGEMLSEFSSIVNGEIENPYSYEYEKYLHSIVLQACGSTKNKGE